MMEDKDWWTLGVQAVGNLCTVFAVWFAASLGQRSALKVQDRSHGDALKQQREQVKDQRRLELFQLLIEKLMQTSSRLSKVNAMVSGVAGSFEVWEKLDVASPRTTLDELTDANSEAVGAVIELVSAIDAHEIMLPGIQTQTEILLAKLDSHGESWQGFRGTVMNPLIALKVARSRNAENQVPRPDHDFVERVRKAERTYSSTLTDLLAYVIDLMRIGQNHLLGPLFGGHVKEREPKGDHVKALRLPPKQPKL